MSNRDKNPKTIIRIRPWLEAKRRPGDGMWALWYLGTVQLEPGAPAEEIETENNGEIIRLPAIEPVTYTGWVQINVARNVKTLLATAPADYMPKEARHG